MKFTYSDIVRVKSNAPVEFRPGARAWIVAVFAAENAPTYRSFAPGPVYTIEYDGGDAKDIEELFLDIDDE